MGQKVAVFFSSFLLFSVPLPLVPLPLSPCRHGISCGAISQVLNELNPNRIRYRCELSGLGLYAGFVCACACACTLAKCNWKIGKKGLRRLRGLSAQGSAAAVAVAVAICYWKMSAKNQQANLFAIHLQKRVAAQGGGHGVNGKHGCAIEKCFQNN